MMLNFFGACGGNQLRQRLSSDAGEGKINDIGITEEIKKERFDRFQRIGPTELEENYTHSPYWLHHPLGSLEKKDVTQNRETSSNPEAKLRSRNLAEKNYSPVRNDSGGFHSFNHRIGKLRRAGLAAHIARKFIPITINPLQSIADLESRIELANMTKHQKSAANNSGGISDIFARDIRRRAMNRLKYRTALAQIRARNNFVLKPGIKSLGIFPDNDQINVGIASGDMRQVTNGAKIRVKLEALAQFDIDTGEPATNRRSHRTLQSNSRALDRFDQLSRNVFVIFLVGVSARLESLPFELQAGCF